MIPDPLARLRAERDAEHAALARHLEHDRQRCELARAFGYRLAVERLTWAEVTRYRESLHSARYFTQYAMTSRNGCAVFGAGEVTFCTENVLQYAALLQGIDAAATAVEARR